METTKQYLFVYGTLLQPGNEFADYLNAHCTFISTGKFKGRLYDIGEYPGAVADSKVDSYVYGSIFLMDDADKILKVIDDYEGIDPAYPYPQEYTREEISVTTETGDLTCWVYFYNLPVDIHTQIISGNYQQYTGDTKI